MKIRGKLVTDKTKAELQNTYIPDIGIFEKMDDKDKPIITYESFTSKEYSQTFLKMGMFNSSDIDFVELVLPRIIKIENLELEDGTKITTGEELGNVTSNQAILFIVTGLGYKLIEEGRFTEEEIKNLQSASK